MSIKIKKLCTYENIQLENADGTRPKGSWARLQKTFIEANFDMTLVQGIGVQLISKEDENPNRFIIPFANIPYIIAEHDNGETPQAYSGVIRRRGRRPRQVSTEPIQEPAPSVSEW